MAEQKPYASSAPSLASASAARLRARRSSADLHRARSGRTAVEIHADMWLMRVSDFLDLRALEPHEKMRAEGKILKWNDSMEHVFFIRCVCAVRSACLPRS